MASNETVLPFPSSSLSEKTKFIGAAQQDFANFAQLSTSSLDIFCPNWRNRDNPQSYVIPPTFNYKRSHKTDEDYHQAKKADKEKIEIDPLIKDRGSDEAEHIVYKSLTQLIQEEFHPPFLTIHNLNIDKLKEELPRIFPRIDCRNETEMKPFRREYDFVIIGRKIGIVAIEVKHSYFTQTKHFKRGDARLPDLIMHAIKQLESVQNLLLFIQKCLGIMIPEGLISQKVLFLPNLERKRFNDWLSSLGKEDMDRLETKLKRCTITYWFQEDMENGRRFASKPPLYSAIRNLMESNLAIVSDEMYETFCPCLAGLASVAVLASADRKLELEFDKVKLSKHAATLKESERVSSQDPSEILKSSPTGQAISTSPKKKPKLDSISAPATVQLFKVIILNPEQKVSFDGPKRQCIVGPAGAGKTIILQAKAIELLKNDQTLLVLAQPCYMKYYSTLFEKNGFGNVKVENWLTVKKSLQKFQKDQDRKFLKSFLTRNQLHSTNSDKIIMEDSGICRNIYNFMDAALKNPSVKSYLRRLSFIKCICNYDHIFVDDAYDDTTSAFDANADPIILPLLMMAFAKLQYPQTTLWIALDIWLNRTRFDQAHMIYRKAYQDFLGKSSEAIDANRDYFSLTQLRQVMRCPENVFQSAYDLDAVWQLKVKPTLGHKIQGLRERKLVVCQSENETMRKIWIETKQKLDELANGNIRFEQVVIIVGDDSYLDDDLQNYLYKKCKSSRIPVGKVINVENDPTNIRVILSGPALASASLDNVLMIYHCRQVSSLEWPVVVYIDYLDGMQAEDDRQMRYRACTRATGNLIEIIALINGYSGQRINRTLSQSQAYYEKKFLEYDCDLEKAHAKKQLANMAGSVSVLAATAHLLNLTDTTAEEREQNRKDFLDDLWIRTRRRCYSVHEIDMNMRVNREDFSVRRWLSRERSHCSSSIHNSQQNT